MSEDIKSLSDLETVADTPEVAVEAVAAPREPVRDDLGRSYATGKRMATIEAKRPRITPSASIMIHFFSISAGVAE